MLSKIQLQLKGEMEDTYNGYVCFLNYLNLWGIDVLKDQIKVQLYLDFLLNWSIKQTKCNFSPAL